MNILISNFFKKDIFLVILFFLPLFTNGTTNWQMIFYILILLLTIYKYKYLNFKNIKGIDFALFFIYLLSVIISFYKNNLYPKDIEKSLIFLSYPIFNYCFIKSDKNIILKYVVYFGFLYEFYFLFSLVTSHIYLTEYEIKEFTNNNFFHSTYLCIFFSIVILACIKVKKEINKITFYFIIIISLIGQFYTFAKMPFISSLLFLFLYFLSHKKHKIILLIFLPILIFLFLVNENYSKVLYDIYDLLGSKNLGKLDYNNYFTFTSQHLRNCIYFASFEAIRNNIFGYGISEAQLVLNSYLYKFDVYLFQIKVFNSHNQFLQFGMYSGLLGILLFIYYLLRLIFLNKRNKFFIYLIVFWIFCFTSESIFERQMGTLLFFFSINIFRNHE